MLTKYINVVQSSRRAPTPVCVSKHCVGSVKKPFPSAAATPGELIWQLNRALVAYFFSRVYHVVSTELSRSDWRQQDSKARVIWASGAVTFACRCCLLIGCRPEEGGPGERGEKSQAVNIRSTCQTWLTSGSKAAGEVTAMFRAGCGLVRGTDTVVQSYRPFP